MKKIVCLLLTVMLFACGCAGEKEAQVYDVGIFSYGLVEAKFQGDQVGVMRSGFRNTVPNPIADGQQAVELAKNECIVSYDSIVVSYDDSTDMYCVCFYQQNVDGGDQLVYMDSQGITKLVVISE